MINISTDKFEKARGIAASMERKVRKLRAANVCPGPSDISTIASLNTLLEEVYAQFEKELADLQEAYSLDGSADDHEENSIENCRAGGC